MQKTTSITSGEQIRTQCSACTVKHMKARSRSHCQTLAVCHAPGGSCGSASLVSSSCSSRSCCIAEERLARHSRSGRCGDVRADMCRRGAGQVRKCRALCGVTPVGPSCAIIWDDILCFNALQSHNACPAYALAWCRLNSREPGCPARNGQQSVVHAVAGQRRVSAW